jgi:hypothetical protein
LSTTTDTIHGLQLTVRRLADPVNKENNDFDFGNIKKLSKGDGTIEVTYKTQDDIAGVTDGWTLLIPKGGCN